MKACLCLRRKLARTLLLSVFLGVLVFGLCNETAIAANGLQSQSATIDLMFVIDNSGSMRKNDPEFITPKVVDTFIRRLPLEARVGMVLFDQTARLIEPLAPVITNEAQGEFVASLDKVDYKGQFTNSAAGIERALYELKIKGRKDSQKGIIFITDGIVDAGNVQKDQELTQWLKQDLTAESRAMGVRIFGIAFSEAADFVLIQALAARTEGEYYRTYDASNILGVLDDILTHLSLQIEEPQPPVPAPAPPVKPEAAEAPPDVPTQTQIQAIETDLRRQTPAVGEKGEPTSENGIQFIFVVLALVVTVLAGVLVFFYIKQMNAMKKETTSPVRPDIPPDAYLEDLEKVLSSEAKPLEIKKARVTLGRDKRNDMIIEKPTVSSFHATIDYKNMIFFLEDQRSTNGTKLNNKKLQPNMPMRLKSGDRISFATFNFKFVVPNQIPFGETAMIAKTALEGPESGSTVVIDLNDSESGQGLVSCLQNHLLQLHSMGQKYRTFAGKYFSYAMLEIIAAKAHENLKNTLVDSGQYCTPIVQHKAFYLVCSLPVPISEAADWYGSQHNGFTQFIMKWIKTDDFKSSQSDMLCVVTFGQDPATWVSLTIVPTQEQEDPVEIMSVDFLNEAEKAMLALDFDHHGRVA